MWPGGTSFRCSARRRLAVTALLGATACAGGASAPPATMGRSGGAPPVAQGATPSSVSPEPTAPLAAPTLPQTTVAVPTTAPPPPPGIGVGARGPEVQALEERLAALHYDVGAVDGRFDSVTASAVLAFQKVNKLPRSGRATDDVLAALQTATDPPPLVPGGGAVRVEIDLPRQVLFLYRDGALLKILPVSSGSGSRYCVDGECARAVTPGGSFRVVSRIQGWHTSRLGRLYNPLFFNGGIAIHGSPSVPAYPASHGCVRISVAQAEWFPSLVPNGTPVYVAGGEIAPVPFNEPAPGQPPPVPPTGVPGEPTTVPELAPPAPTPPPPTTPTTTLSPLVFTTTTTPGPAS